VLSAAALVLMRSAVFLAWEHAGFDSDQAIFGLMAKHIVEGRAFPVFIYGDDYLLAVQAWLAAPLFALFGPSVGVLKIPVVLVNVATAVLLLWVLHRDAGLTPAAAFGAAVFFVFATPLMAGSLVETGGGNPEPFLYVLLLWILRHRPIAFGLVLGFGFVHREFTAYGAGAIVLLALLDDWRPSMARFRIVALAAIGYLIVTQAIRGVFMFSTPFGPGTDILSALGGGDNVAGLVARACFEPAAILPSMGTLFGYFMGIPFGASGHRLNEFGVRSLLPAEVVYWPVLGGVFALALGRVAWISIRDRKPVWRGRGAVGTFLLLVGLQAGVAYALARCGRLEVVTFRYALLMLYTGVGIVALYFVYETRVGLRRAMAAVVIAWTAVAATSHARLLREFVFDEPANPRRELADFLVANDIRYATADYWTAYSTTFLSGEQVVVASTDVVRIDEYQRLIAAHPRESVAVEHQACAGGSEAVNGMYWICPR
jgi:hypothetical protein